MSDVAIRMENLGKRYRRGTHAPYHRFSEVLQNVGRAAVSLPARLRPRRPATPAVRTDSADFWALKDVSFEVKQGEVVGMIGRNGAGKSTLLKILSRITEPTTGRFGVRGRVASLLEVGTGFHPELTGRENIHLSGTLLGMTRREIDRRFDEIVSFAEIDDFLDTPVKRYSSGMYVRLGFAIAAHLQPEILIVDEVLAVGDAAFQSKCLGKMGDVARSGRTVLFVSHDMQSIRQLTSRVICLRNGQSSCIGKPSEVIESYLSAGANQDGAAEQPGALSAYRRGREAGDKVRFRRIWVSAGAGGEIRQTHLPRIPSGEPFRIHFEIESQRLLESACLSASLFSSFGGCAATLFSRDAGFRFPLQPGVQTVSCRIRHLPLSPGRYLVQAGINETANTTGFDGIFDYPLVTIDLPGLSSGQIEWPNRRWGAVHWTDVDWTYHVAASATENGEYSRAGRTAATSMSAELSGGVPA